LKFAIFVFAAMTLVGCTTHVITSSNKDAVTIKYYKFLYNREQIEKIADKECARNGRHAKFIESSRLTALSMLFDRFDCVKTNG